MGIKGSIVGPRLRRGAVGIGHMMVMKVLSRRLPKGQCVVTKSASVWLTNDARYVYVPSCCICKGIN